MATNRWKHVAHEAVVHTRSILRVNWHLGFTAFGGPPVHFKIVSRISGISLEKTLTAR